MILARRILFGKRKDHAGVCKKTPSPWSLSPCRTGSLWCTLCSLIQSNLVTVYHAQCVHKFRGVFILHVETECVLCPLKDHALLKILGVNTLHSAHSLVRQRLGNREQQLTDRSERCAGSEGLLGGGGIRGALSSAIYLKCGQHGKIKRPQAAQIKEVHIQAWGFYSAHEGQAWRHCKKLRSSVHSRAHDLTGEKAVSDPWSVFHQTAQDNF